MGLTRCLVLLAINLAALVAASPFRSKYDVNVVRELLARLKEPSAKSLLFDKETLADCTVDDADACVSQWPVDYCEKYSNVPDDCPAMCGTCKKKLPASSSDTCPGYDNSYCGDPLHPADCTATSFVPNACPAMCGLCKAKPPVCTKDDEFKCGGTWTVDQCKTDSVAKACPAMCGLCMKKLPASPSDECPEYDNGYCGNELSSSDCTESAIVPLACPAMCGLCKQKPVPTLDDCTKDDTSNCNQASVVSSCSTNDNTKDQCPAMCGLCKKKLPALHTDNCPEYDNWYCGEIWLPSDCDRFFYVSAACPGMCGLCKKKTPPNDDGNDTPGDVVVPMPACDAKYKAVDDHTMCRKPGPLLVPGGKVYDGQKWLIINLHNKLRAKPYPQDPTVFGSAMQMMVWDDNIAKVAQNLANTCVFAHDHDRDVIGYSYWAGQNLGKGYGNWESAIEDGWYGEVKDFVYGKGAKDGVAVVGHYTALVKEDSARIGCGYALCKNNDKPDSGTWPYYVCNYAKIQSDMTKPFVIGEQCGQCPSKCNAGLCDCKGKICETGGEINLDTCECKCPALWNGSPRCTVLSCPDQDGGDCGFDGWTQTDCDSSYIRDKCPYLCGLCKMPTPSSPSDDCPKQDILYCGISVPQSDCATYASSACPGMCGLCKKLLLSCPDQDDGYCGNRGWTRTNCNSRYIREKCPSLCGLCRMPTPSSPSADCLNQDNSYCGRLVLQSDCATYASTGCPGMCGLCKKLPPDCTDDDKSKCFDGWTVDQCSDESVASACPAMCGLCMKRLPKLATDECPDYENWYCNGPLTQSDCAGKSYVPRACPAMCGLCKKKPIPVLSDCTKDDAFYCVTQWPVGYCKKYHNVPDDCPSMCSTCKKKLPASSSSPCPEKDNPYCGVPDGWVKTDCSKFYYVRNSCPGMCGLCQPTD